ncbi:hypothetical protein [Amycolatopsis benzoatilytica]|uniref:hypothetical protein n=1 Tax=Amycolatopsis benzoatilytica TaxID=346045 RepID=UPI0012B68942|nr:hypothetical protein [Amycolatopsis benzoatilytica]
MDVREANRLGQQLFLADLFREKRPDPVVESCHPRRWPAHYPVAHRQLTLFDLPRRHPRTRRCPLDPPLPDLEAALEYVLLDHAASFGWRDALVVNARGVIRILLALQDTPGAAIPVSDVAAVTKGRGVDNLKSVLEVLASAGMLDDDRQSALDGFFAQHAARLPEQLAQEFGQWFDVRRHGTTTPPRYKPTGESTLRRYVASLGATLKTWADAGYKSLREIDRQAILDVLPDSASDQRRTLSALRDLFRVLKGKQVIFTNPATRLPRIVVRESQPMPMELTKVREALNCGKPVREALAALVAFHALRSSELRRLLLTDLHDRRLHIGQRTVPVAPHVQEKITAWLNERARRWPNTVNPHLFINGHTGVRTCAVTPSWISNTIGASADAIRQDRILNEATATDGDARRLSDFFGITTQGSERYTRTVTSHAASSTTQGFS